MNREAVTRFAPSPTGPLHLGHAFAASVAHDLARKGGGRFLLRIEDIDRQRARPEWERGIREDLAWLGLHWDGVPMRQSERQPAYDAALDRLWALGLLYPCHCRRRDIEAALGAPQEGSPAAGPDGPVYPGTCRRLLDRTSRMVMPRPAGVHLRLDMALAAETGLEGNPAPAGASFRESCLSPGRVVLSGEDLVRGIGDVVLARKDFGTSYHLSVVVDDAAQGVTLVSRGADLFGATPIHVLLQRLLGLPTPEYHHHPLVRDAAGRRLAKRDDARSIGRYREDGLAPDAVLALARDGAGQR